MSNQLFLLFLYRFTSPSGTAWTKSFENDDAALKYAADISDDVQMAVVERTNGDGDWFSYNSADGSWVYNPNASKESVPHCRPDSADGFRNVMVGEFIKKGDQVQLESGQWVGILIAVGIPLLPDQYGKVRRPLFGEQNVAK